MLPTSVIVLVILVVSLEAYAMLSFRCNRILVGLVAWMLVGLITIFAVKRVDIDVYNSVWCTLSVLAIAASGLTLFGDKCNLRKAGLIGLIGLATIGLEFV